MSYYYGKPEPENGFYDAAQKYHGFIGLLALDTERVLVCYNAAQFIASRDEAHEVLKAERWYSHEEAWEAFEHDGFWCRKDALDTEHLAGKSVEGCKAFFREWWQERINRSLVALTYRKLYKGGSYKYGFTFTTPEKREVDILYGQIKRFAQDVAGVKVLHVYAHFEEGYTPDIILYRDGVAIAAFSAR